MQREEEGHGNKRQRDETLPYRRERQKIVLEERKEEGDGSGDEREVASRDTETGLHRAHTRACCEGIEDVIGQHR